MLTVIIAHFPPQFRAPIPGPNALLLAVARKQNNKNTTKKAITGAFLNILLAMKTARHCRDARLLNLG